MKKKSNFREKKIMWNRGLETWAFGGFGLKIGLHRSGLEVGGLCRFYDVTVISAADGLVSRESWQ